MASDLAPPVGYGDFLNEVKAQVRQRQYQALRAANQELLGLYWWIGEAISRRQTERGWGKAVVETLARDLQTEFPGRNGFSAQNLWLMRQFFNEYADKPKLQPLVGEISWAKNVLQHQRPSGHFDKRWRQESITLTAAHIAALHQGKLLAVDVQEEYVVYLKLDAAIETNLKEVGYGE